MPLVFQFDLGDGQAGIVAGEYVDFPRVVGEAEELLNELCERPLIEKTRYLVGVELKEGETEDFKLWQEVLGASDTDALEDVREA